MGAFPSTRCSVESTEKLTFDFLTVDLEDLRGRGCRGVGAASVAWRRSEEKRMAVAAAP
ncbi:MAG: hypothetical protein U0166_03525 [Acidobacteriota bacterium]